MAGPTTSHLRSTVVTLVAFAAVSLVPSGAAALILLAQTGAPRTARAGNDTALAVHVLNRLAFGPRPGEVDRLLKTGVDQWIEQQLKPDHTLDSAALLALRGCDLWTEPVGSAVQRLSGREAFQMVDKDGAMRNASIASGSVAVVSRDSAKKIVGSPQRGLYLANTQLHACRLARVEKSEWQLLEVMTDFWENHFSIHGQKVPVRGSLIEYDRYTIRPNALGRFRDLLGAVARSPAMLHYLDNAVNSSDSTRTSLVPYTEPARPRLTTTIPVVYVRPGLNENYARELLELHTMGVDGGYSQDDVINVARALTGWSHGRAVPGGDELASLVMMMRLFEPTGDAPSLRFVFDSSRHDAEEKVVLGHTLAAGRGMQDGEEVLDILARHPSTARFIARKLAVRFVSDDPPEALVERAAQSFLQSDGRISEVLRTIVMSPEFRGSDAFGAKIKAPVEFVLSMRRALGAPVDTEGEMVDLLVQLEQPPFGRHSPDGWPETASGWMNVGAMSARINVATRAGSGLLPSIPLTSWPHWGALASRPFDAQLAGVSRFLLHGQLSASTKAALAALRPDENAADDAAARERSLRDLITFALGSPEFQRR